MISPKVKAVFFFCLALTFGILIFGGYAINKEKPPIPAKVLDHSGSVLFTSEDVIGGQNYFYSRGGQHIGTIWGHGAYLAPDWSSTFAASTSMKPCNWPSVRPEIMAAPLTWA